MHDVAKKAGVSYQTVSRVLNNSCNVSNSTKEKIEQAIAELKYVPNLLAQQLAKKEVNTIGLINAAVLSLSTVEVTLCVRKYAEQNNYNLESKLVSNFTSQGIQDSIDELRSLLITKIIVNAPVNSQDAIFLTEQNKDIKILFVDVDPYCPVLNVTFNPADGTLFSVSHLKQLGHTLLIDDFGMGHTSLVYLQSNYFDVVKLDGSLVWDILKNTTDQKIVASVVDLGNKLGIHVIAEYVETEEQKEKLEELGCYWYQGYLYSKPVSLQDFITWMKQWNEKIG